MLLGKQQEKSTKKGERAKIIWMHCFILSNMFIEKIIYYVKIKYRII